MDVNLAVEGSTDQYVIDKVLQHTGLSSKLVRGLKGKNDLINNLSKYNNAARWTTWVVVLDLDRETACASEYVQQILPEANELMVLRIAVQAIESWLLADREHLAKYLNIPVENITLNPDLEDNPKITFLNLVRRSGKTAIKQDILPREGSGARVGAGYATRIYEFVNQTEFTWRPEIAKEQSESLRRCIRALKKLTN